MLFHGHTLLKASDVSKHIRSNGRQAEYIDRKGVHVVVGKYVGDSLGKDPTDDYLEGMMNEAPGPINFTMFLTLFGERLQVKLPCARMTGFLNINGNWQTLNFIQNKWCRK